MKLISHVIFHITKLCFSFHFGWKGVFSWGSSFTRSLYSFTGSTNTSSLLAWSNIDIDRTNYRSINPRSRAYGVGAYGQDTMLNIAAFRGSSGRAGSYRHYFANSGQISSAAATQISSLGTRPWIFWDARNQNYTIGSSAGFANQNGGDYLSIFRIADSDIITDFTGGSESMMTQLNRDTNLDDQLFSINGTGKGNTINGTPISKVIMPAAFTDFSSTRPFLMSLVGGLPKNGDDTLNKDQPTDAWHRAGNHNYYLNYYPKYDGTSKKLLAKDDGLDWRSINVRQQIDGTQPLAAISASAESSSWGYSKVGIFAYMKLY